VDVGVEGGDDADAPPEPSEPQLARHTSRRHSGKRRRLSVFIRLPQSGSKDKVRFSAAVLNSTWRLTATCLLTPTGSCAAPRIL
jgi:hypothetical protein